jgi:hypothetical protein
VLDALQAAQAFDASSLDAKRGDAAEGTMSLR